MANQLGKFSYFILSALLVGATWLLYSHFSHDDEAEILNLLTQACSLAEVDGQGHPIENAAKAKKLSQLFTEDLSFEMVLKGDRRIWFESRDKLQKSATMFRHKLKSLEFAFSNSEIEIGKGLATAVLDASALGSMPGAKGEFFEHHRVKVSFLRKDGEWLIQAVEHLENLRE